MDTIAFDWALTVALVSTISSKDTVDKDLFVTHWPWFYCFLETRN